MYNDVLEFMPYIQGDVVTTIAVTRLIAQYLETADTVMLPIRVEAIIFQNVLQWLYSEFLDVRWNATRILLALSRNSENKGIVNHQLVDMIDSDSVYIKNLILRHLHEVSGLSDETQDYIISKCKHEYVLLSFRSKSFQRDWWYYYTNINEKRVPVISFCHPQVTDLEGNRGHEKLFMPLYRDMFYVREMMLSKSLGNI